MLYIMTIQYKRKRTPKKKVPKKSIAKVAKRAVLSMSEKKFHDQMFSHSPGTIWDSTGAITSLSDVAVGTSDSQRIGDRIRGQKLKLQMAMYANAAASSTVRVIVFRWKLRYATDTPTPGAIIKNAFIGTVYAPMGDYDKDNRVSFEVLSDRKYSCGSGSDAVHKITQYIDLKNKPIQYHAGSVSDCNFGIYALFLPDTSAVSSPTVNCVSRFTYTDL